MFNKRRVNLFVNNFHTIKALKNLQEKEVR